MDRVIVIQELRGKTTVIRKILCHRVTTIKHSQIFIGVGAMIIVIRFAPFYSVQALVNQQLT